MDLKKTSFGCKGAWGDVAELWKWPLGLHVQSNPKYVPDPRLGDSAKEACQERCSHDLSVYGPTCTTKDSQIIQVESIVPNYVRGVVLVSEFSWSAHSHCHEPMLDSHYVLWEPEVRRRQKSVPTHEESNKMWCGLIFGKDLFDWAIDVHRTERMNVKTVW